MKSVRRSEKRRAVFGSIVTRRAVHKSEACTGSQLLSLSCDHIWSLQRCSTFSSNLSSAASLKVINDSRRVSGTSGLQSIYVYMLQFFFLFFLMDKTAKNHLNWQMSKGVLMITHDWSSGLTAASPLKLCTNDLSTMCTHVPMMFFWDHRDHKECTLWEGKAYTRRQTYSGKEFVHPSCKPTRSTQPTQKRTLGL